MENASHQSPHESLSQVAQKHSYQSEILLKEKRDVTRKGWVEKSVYYTGAGFFSGVLGGGVKGVLGGGVKGVLEGVKAAETGDSLKIRTSRVLHAGKLNGIRFGGTLGFMSVLFSSCESLTENVTGVGYGVNSVFAGMSTGVVYNAVSGSRPVPFAAVVGALAGGSFFVGKKVVQKFVDLPL